jgi:prevent-host-death family protein
MKSIKASDFKATCLKIMDDVAETGEPVLVTKNGKPVGKFVPYRKKATTLLGAAREQIRIKGDIVNSDEHWDADQ